MDIVESVAKVKMSCSKVVFVTDFVVKGCLIIT